MVFGPKGSKVTGPMRMGKPKGLPRGVVGKRAANNQAETPRLGLQNKVTDNDPMARESDGNYP
jgi:hypothetical protein